MLGGETLDLDDRGFKKRVLIFTSRRFVMKEGWSNRFSGEMFTEVLMRGVGRLNSRAYSLLR